MKKIALYFLAAVAVCAALVFFICRPSEDEKLRMEAKEQIDKISSALGDEWTELVRAEEEITPYVYTDSNGNELIYYVCKTTMLSGELSEEDVGALLHEIIDPETAEERKACKVCDLDAMHYLKEGRAYLCWTVSPEYSLAIEYDPLVVSEADIFRMAESVPISAQG